MTDDRRIYHFNVFTLQCIYDLFNLTFYEIVQRDNYTKNDKLL